MEPRFAEESFPMKEISEISSKEKSIRQGHMSTLHIWWARKPLAASRATCYTALTPNPNNSNDIQRKMDFVVNLSQWHNSFNRSLLGEATKEILIENNGVPPKVLDPFAGGGSLPLESYRLGCETYASDYNPVSVIILRCTLEFTQKYGSVGIKSIGLVTEKRNSLIEDIRKWSNWVIEEARKEIGLYYFAGDGDGYTPVGYLWTRTVRCQNPSCNAEIPLMRQYWLVKRSDRRISLYPYVTNKIVRFRIIGTGYGEFPADFNPDKGTISRSIASCLVCGSVIDNKTIARLFTDRQSDQRMVAVILHKKGATGKKYRISDDRDYEIFKKAEEYLHAKRDNLTKEFGFDPVPDEPITRVPVTFGVINVWIYGMNTWGDLFNSRQKLALITFVEKVRKSYDRMVNEGYADEYAKVIVTYLALTVDRLADKNAMFTHYDATRETIENVFGRQAIGMIWYYAEVNSFTDVGWPNMQNWIELVVKHCCNIKLLHDSQKIPQVTQSSATELAFSDNYFDAVFTDPPYYDNIPYSYLSDFFYVWLKRTIGHLYPELFATPLTPKSKEIVAYSSLKGDPEAGKNFFEAMLKKSFQEISRVLKPNGICVIVYAHKSTAGWETLINSLLSCGLVVTAAWPIRTELKQRLRASESATLASSIYMVARKYEKKAIGFYRDIRKDLNNHLNKELNKLWNEGVSGADFLVSAIGSAIEVFGMYQKIIDDEGNEIRAEKLLERIRSIVTDYAVKQVLHNGFAEEITQMTRLYVLWRWAFGEAKIPFDDARKLAQSVGMDLTSCWNKGFIQKDKEFIRILGPSDRNWKDVIHSKELIDVLHRVLLLWSKGNGYEIIDVLKHSQFGKSDAFYRIAQAISESLPNESKEKKWIEGFLAGKSRISRELELESGQQRLLE